MTHKFACNTLAYSLLFITPAVVVAQETESKPVLVTVEPVSTKSTSQNIQEVGKITATDAAHLSFNDGAQIKAIHFKDGDNIKQGDLIAELDTTKAKADLDKAKSSLNLAESKLERTLNLLKKQPDSLSPQDVEELEESVKLAAADFRQKEATLNDFTIVAPFDGRLTKFSHSIGSHIDASTQLVSLYKLDPVNVTYSISQEDLSRATTGQNVNVTVSAFPDQVFEGKVNYIAPAVDENSGRVEVQASIKNPEFVLAPGMFANVNHQLNASQSVLAIKQNSVAAHNDTRYVWVVENDKPVRKEVKLGSNTNDGYVTVLSGLEKGEHVVTTGQQSLFENSQIKVLETQQKAKTAEETPVEENTSTEEVSPEKSQEPKTEVPKSEESKPETSQDEVKADDASKLDTPKKDAPKEEASAQQTPTSDKETPEAE